MEGVPHPDARRPVSSSTCVPQEPCKQSRWYLSQCAPGETPTAQGTGDGTAAAFYLMNFSPEFQSPYLHFSSPCNKGWFKMELKTADEGT